MNLFNIVQGLRFSCILQEAHKDGRVYFCDRACTLCHQSYCKGASIIYGSGAVQIGGQQFWYKQIEGTGKISVQAFRGEAKFQCTNI